MMIIDDFSTRYYSRLYRNISAEVFELLLLVFGICTVVIIIIWGWTNGWKKVIGLLLVEYVFLIYYSTVIIRKVKEGVEHNFCPFWSYEAIRNGREDLILEHIVNILAFVPVGVMLWCIFLGKKIWLTLAVGIGGSVSIEVLQYVLKRGFAEFDDVFHNTIGLLLGYMFMAIIKGIWSLHKRYLMN